MDPKFETAEVRGRLLHALLLYGPITYHQMATAAGQPSGPGAPAHSWLRLLQQELAQSARRTSGPRLCQLTPKGTVHALHSLITHSQLVEPSLLSEALQRPHGEPIRKFLNNRGWKRLPTAEIVALRYMEQLDISAVGFPALALRHPLIDPLTVNTLKRLKAMGQVELVNCAIRMPDNKWYRWRLTPAGRFEAEQSRTPIPDLDPSEFLSQMSLRPVLVMITADNFEFEITERQQTVLTTLLNSDLPLTLADISTATRITERRWTEPIAVLFDQGLVDRDVAAGAGRHYCYSLSADGEHLARQLSTPETTLAIAVL